MRITQLSFVLVVFFSLILHEVKGGIGSSLLESFKRLIRLKCVCSENECCSKLGYCGKTDAYCGEGCQSGPCKASRNTIHDYFGITSEAFECVFPNIDDDLRAQRFKGLIEAMELMKWKPMNSTEAAVFLSHVSHETDGLKTLVEYCSKQGSK
jgi:hypothetical protein